MSDSDEKLILSVEVDTTKGSSDLKQFADDVTAAGAQIKTSMETTSASVTAAAATSAEALKVQSAAVVTALEQESGAVSATAIAETNAILAIWAENARARGAIQAGESAALKASTADRAAAYTEQIRMAAVNSAARVAAAEAGVAAQTAAVLRGASVQVAAEEAGYAAANAALIAGADKEVAIEAGLRAASIAASKQAAATENQIVTESYDQQLSIAAKNIIAHNAAVEAGNLARTESLAKGAALDEAAVAAGYAAQAAAAESGASVQVAALEGLNAAKRAAAGVDVATAEESVGAYYARLVAAETTTKAETAVVAEGAAQRKAIITSEMEDIVAATVAARGGAVGAVAATEADKATIIERAAAERAARNTAWDEALTRSALAEGALRTGAAKAEAQTQVQIMQGLAQGVGTASREAVGFLKTYALDGRANAAAAVEALRVVAAGATASSNVALEALRGIAASTVPAAGAAATALASLTPEIAKTENAFRLLSDASYASGNPLRAIGRLGQDAVGPLGAVALAAVASAAAIGAAIYAVEKFSDAAQVVTGVRQGFDTLTKSVNLNAEELLGKMRPAAQGLISDFSLMKSVNESVILGFHATSDQMAEATRVTTLLARAMGLDATEALDRFVEGVGRERPIMLARIGVVVKAADAYKEYADQIGKLPGQLTPAEKVQAFFNAALESGQKAAADLTPPMATLSQNVHEFNVSVTDAKNATLDWLNVILGDTALETEIKRLNAEKQARSGVTKATEEQAAALKKLHDEQAYRDNLKVVQAGPNAPSPQGESNSTQDPELSAFLAGLTGPAAAILPGLTVDFGKLMFATVNATESQAKFNVAIKAMEIHDAKANLESLGKAYSDIALAPVWKAIDDRNADASRAIDTDVDDIVVRLRQAKEGLKQLDAEFKNPATTPERRTGIKSEERKLESEIKSIEDPDAKKHEKGLLAEDKYQAQLDKARVEAAGKWSVEAQALEDQFLTSKYKREEDAEEKGSKRIGLIHAARDQEIAAKNQEYEDHRFARSMRSEEELDKAKLKSARLTFAERADLEIKALMESTAIAMLAARGDNETQVTLFQAMLARRLEFLKHSAEEETRARIQQAERMNSLAEGAVKLDAQRGRLDASPAVERPVFREDVKTIEDRELEKAQKITEIDLLENDKLHSKIADQNRLARDLAISEAGGNEKTEENARAIYRAQGLNNAADFENKRTEILRNAAQKRIDIEHASLEHELSATAAVFDIMAGNGAPGSKAIHAAANLTRSLIEGIHALSQARELAHKAQMARDAQEYAAAMKLDHQSTQAKLAGTSAILAATGSAVTEIFGKTKGGAIAGILLNTAAGITHALADPGGYAGVVLAVIAGAMGAAQLAAAQSVSLDGGGSIASAGAGGSPSVNYSGAVNTPGGQNATATTPVLVTGAPIITQQQQPPTGPLNYATPQAPQPLPPPTPQNDRQSVLATAQPTPVVITLPAMSKDSTSYTTPSAPLWATASNAGKQPDSQDSTKPPAPVHITIHAIDSKSIEDLFNDRTKARAFVEGAMRYNARS